MINFPLDTHFSDFTFFQLIVKNSSVETSDMELQKCGKCSKDANSICTNCKSIYYCSRDCQKADWKNHKKNCSPFEIKNDEKLGRFLKANRDIAKDSIILSELPCVVGPKWNNSEDDEDRNSFQFSCVGCFEPIKMLHHRCPSCQWPACSPNCIGLTNIELHDIECALLKIGKGPVKKTDIRSIKDYYRMDALLALKILLLQRKNPKKFKSLMTMESNENNRLLTYNFKEAEEKINYLEENFLNPLRKAEEKTAQIILPDKDKKLLHKIFGVIETNAMYINLSTGTEVCGLFSTGCLLEHACLPNCSYKFDMKNGFKLIVQAARDIKINEHLSTSYSHVLWGTQLRQQHLKETKYFTCKCERCKDPSELGTNFSSLRCLGTDELGPCNGLQMPIDPLAKDIEWACSKCPIKISNDQVSFLTGKMGEDIDNMLASTPSAKDLEELIDKLSSFLHPNHYHMFSLKHSLLQLYGMHKNSPINKLSDEILLKKLDMCNELMEIVKKFDPYCIRLQIYTGIILYEKYNALMELRKRGSDKGDIEEAKKCLEEAEKILVNELDSMQGKQLNQKIIEALSKI